MRKSYTPDQLVQFIKDLLEENRKQHLLADNTFPRWISTARLAEKTGWIKRKVRYEFDKLVTDGKIETYHPPHFAYKTYSVPEYTGCVRFGEFFKIIN